MEARKVLAFGLVAIIILLFITGYGILTYVAAKLHYAVSGTLMVTLYDPQKEPISLPSPNSILPLDFMYQGKEVAYVGAKVHVDAIVNKSKLNSWFKNKNDRILQIHYKIVLHIQRYWIPPSSSPTPRPLGEKTLSKEGTANVTKNGKIGISVVFGLIPLDQLLPDDKPDGSQFKLAITAEVILSPRAFILPIPAGIAKATSDEVDIYVSYSEGSEPSVTPPASTTSAPSAPPSSQTSTTTSSWGGGGGIIPPGRPRIRYFEIVRVTVTPTTT